jgi:hypothetical protein
MVKEGFAFFHQNCKFIEIIAEIEWLLFRSLMLK